MTQFTRFANQSAAILDLLRKGPATNRELADLALKYTSRISDLRKSGYTITATPLGGGLVEYRLGG